MHFGVQNFLIIPVPKNLWRISNISLKQYDSEFNAQVSISLFTRQQKTQIKASWMSDLFMINEERDP